MHWNHQVIPHWNRNVRDSYPSGAYHAAAHRALQSAERPCTGGHPRRHLKRPQPPHGAGSRPRDARALGLAPPAHVRVAPPLLVRPPLT
jgi:hypothetical protein